MAELVIDQLRRQAEERPQAPLLPRRTGADWQRLTNARAWADSGAVASWLIAQGFGPGGRRLTVPADDTPLRAVVLLGALRAGALVVDGWSDLEFAALARCSIDAAVAERRLHLDADTPARLKDGVCRRQGDLATIAEAVDV
jgi:feruloyl-CoA synthase